MRGVEQRGATVFSLVRGVAEDMVGIGSYRRELGRERGQRPVRDINALAAGLVQVVAPWGTRTLDKALDPPPKNRLNVVDSFSLPADLAVLAALIVLFGAGMVDGMQAVALKAVYNAGANVVYDAMEARARRSSSTPQT